MQFIMFVEMVKLTHVLGTVDRRSLILHNILHILFPNQLLSLISTEYVNYSAGINHNVLLFY